MKTPWTLVEEAAEHLNDAANSLASAEAAMQTSNATAKEKNTFVMHSDAVQEAIVGIEEGSLHDLRSVVEDTIHYFVTGGRKGMNTRRLGRVAMGISRLATEVEAAKKKEKSPKDIKVEHEGVLESAFPDGDLFKAKSSHMITLAKRIGKGPVMKMLNNLVRWNKNREGDDPKTEQSYKAVSEYAEKLVGQLKKSKKWADIPAMSKADSEEAIKELEEELKEKKKSALDQALDTLSRAINDMYGPRTARRKSASSGTFEWNEEFGFEMGTDEDGNPVIERVYFETGDRGDLPRKDWHIYFKGNTAEEIHAEMLRIVEENRKKGWRFPEGAAPSYTITYEFSAGSPGRGPSLHGPGEPPEPAEIAIESVTVDDTGKEIPEEYLDYDYLEETIFDSMSRDDDYDYDYDD